LNNRSIKCVVVGQIKKIYFLDGGLSLKITAFNGNIFNALSMKIYMLLED
jgi:hypothetical protein